MHRARFLIHQLSSFVESDRRAVPLAVIAARRYDLGQKHDYLRRRGG
jgi:hypothetical protein